MSNGKSNEIPADTIIASKYRVVKRIGSGSFGEIYSGTHIYESKEQCGQMVRSSKKKS